MKDRSISSTNLAVVFYHPPPNFHGVQGKDFSALFGGYSADSAPPPRCFRGSIGSTLALHSEGPGFESWSYRILHVIALSFRNIFLASHWSVSSTLRSVQGNPTPWTGDPEGWGSNPTHVIFLLDLLIVL